MKEFTHRQLFLWQHVFFEHLTPVLVTTVAWDFPEDASSTENKKLIGWLPFETL